MEEQHYAARAHLRDLQQKYPHWTHQRMADEIGYSVGWVQKWRRRFRQADPHDEAILHGLSRRRHTPYARTHPLVVERILAIRDEPPRHLQRTPGPKAILAFLQEDTSLKALNIHIPTSTATLWRILDENERIKRTARVEPEPLERPAPMSSWAIDYKDITTVSPDPDGKQQHSLEALNVVDEGTSLWLDYHLRGDFCAETTLHALVLTFHKLGMPEQIRFDRDTRLVGPAGLRDFPSAFRRFLLCLGIQLAICPPHHPQKNPFVERLHGTLERECIQVHKPRDASQANDAFANFHYHYHHERPHQGLACGNQTPAQAFPTLPPLPPVPNWVDPDRWVWSLKDRRFPRKVRSAGSITIDKQNYYIGTALAGQYVVVFVDPKARELVVYHQHKLLKRMPIKGLKHTLMAFDEYLKWISQQAQSERRQLAHVRKRGLR